MSSLRLTNYKDKINIPKKNFKNRVKISMDEDHEGKILIEVVYIKKNNIYNKHLKIFKDSLLGILEKFKQNKFLILENDNLTDISNLNNIVNNNSHPEYKSNNHLIRNSYNNSFNQKFK
tara:strand:+ start:109 stop:465 length:357 start_codon:yes stop_codon:yes gene_type:complete